MNHRSAQTSPRRQQEITVRSGQLVVLVGASGSGKTHFARKHFSDTEILSSDRLRAMIADDEADQAASAAAFDLLHRLLRLRLERGRTTVVDATNATAQARADLTAIARELGTSATAIVFDLSIDECIARDASRPARSVGPDVIRRQIESLAGVERELHREQFDSVVVLDGPEAVDTATVVRAG